MVLELEEEDIKTILERTINHNQFIMDFGRHEGNLKKSGPVFSSCNPFSILTILG